EVERIVAIARAANAYHDECYAAGRPTGVEEVLVCHPHASKISAARKLLGRAVKVAELPAAPKAEEPKRKRTPAGSASKKPSARRTARLSEDEIGRARATAGPYDRSRTYTVGDFFLHSKFGVGRVDELTPEGFILVLFEDGEQ